LILILVLLILCGCTSYNKTTSLDAVFENNTGEYRQNNFSEYLDYYLPSDMLEEDFGFDHVTFSFNHNEVIMNVNIASVIASKYYVNYVLTDDGYFDNSKLIYSHQGTYINHDKQMVAYFYKVYSTDNYNLLYFKSSDLVFYGYCDDDNLIDMSEKIFNLAKSATVKTDSIISTYSTKDVIDYTKSQIDLFDVVLPNSGRIDDLIKDDKDVNNSNQ